MTLKLSTALRNFVAGYGSLKRAMHGGRIEIYSGAQPANADAAVTGTLLCTITDNSGAFTAEVRASGSVTLTGGAGGSLNTLTVNGVEVMGSATPFNTSLTQTAADIAAKINAFQSPVEYVASASGAVVTLTAMPGTGASPNGFVVASTATTLTKTDANLSGGAVGANGLKFSQPGVSAGLLSKLAAQVWSGVNAASGVAGYYRWYASVADSGGLDASGVYLREDGAVAVSGAELNLTSTTLTLGVTTTISQWDRTIPTL